jgi:hypothetical protein
VLCQTIIHSDVFWQDAALRAVGAAMLGLCAYAIYTTYAYHKGPSVAKAKHMTAPEAQDGSNVDIQMETMADKAVDAVEQAARTVKKGVTATVENGALEVWPFHHMRLHLHNPRFDTIRTIVPHSLEP